MSSFKLDRQQCFCVCRVVGEGELDKDVTIQANHLGPNISSANSS
jgi:hypothetical protein